MKVVEIFKSIQGEGSYLGVPCVFVRLYGCNLNCSFCDTKESWDGSSAHLALEMSVDEVIHKVDSFNLPMVVITGGEPCLESLLGELVDKLKLRKHFVAIETNGTLPTPPGIDWVVCSPKEAAAYNINVNCKFNELKYVVTDDFDADKSIPWTLRQMYPGKIWLQPEGSDMQNMWQKAFDLALADPRLRVGIQLHKIMEVR